MDNGSMAGAVVPRMDAGRPFTRKCLPLGASSWRPFLGRRAMIGWLIIPAFPFLSGCFGTPGDTTDPFEWDMAWKCEGLSLYASGIRGKVVAQDIEQFAQYSIQGLEHKWYWGWNEEDKSDYGVTLDGDAAWYFDFTTAQEKNESGHRIAVSSKTFRHCYKVK